jgi:hypothetical protein
MRTRLLACFGTPVQDSGGEMFFPWQVYDVGMALPSAKAGELISMAMIVSLPARASIVRNMKRITVLAINCSLRVALFV